MCVSHFPPARRLPGCSLLAGLATAVLLAAASPSRAVADGLVQKLPADGAWVEYHLVIVGGGNEIIGTLRLQSVGRETADDTPSRWIEIVMRPADEATPTTIYRMQIPEQRLTRGVDPVDFAARAWEKQGDGEPKPTDSRSLNRGFVGAFLHGPPQSAKKLTETRKIACQQGTLEASGIAGHRKLDLPNLQGTLKSQAWLHAKVPFGAAALTVELLDSQNRSTLRVELVVNDFGTGAEPLLPDLK